MIIIVHSEASEAQVEAVVKRLAESGLDSNVSRGVERTMIGAIGDESKLDKELMQALPAVEDVIRVMKPYKMVARAYHKADTVIEVGGVQIGGNTRRTCR